MWQEDDAAFWNRLVPVDERAEGGDAAELGVRAARLRAADEVGHSVQCLQSGPYTPNLKPRT